MDCRERERDIAIACRGREHEPKLLGDDGGISEPPARAVTPVDLLHPKGSGGLRTRASRRV